MVPTWMIKELERLRRERELVRREWPQLRVELPGQVEDQPRPAPAPTAPIVIELG
ncbi:MAG TPA: hypothetical protein VFR85_18720 [Anaeromyxobacteraceae bacterium]|nr:hypothetical protein [Anaeromyxobacteraceae bacterium]